MTFDQADSVFITLISAAKEDPDLAGKLLNITRLPEIDRKTRVKLLVKECQFQGAPIEFIEALSLLGETAIARKVSEYLSDVQSG